MIRSHLTFRDIRRNPTAQIASIILVLLVVSLLLFFLRSDRSVERVFFFPESSFGQSYEKRRPEAASRLFGETRRLPLRRGTEQNIRLLVEDIILGPVEPLHIRLLPEDTRLISLVWNRSELYVNFTASVFTARSESDLSLGHRLQGVANTILFNFPVLKRIFFFIEGQVPEFRSTGEESAVDYSAGLAYDPSILD